MKTIKVGIIGAGGVAQLGHIPSYQSIQGVEIAALCDPNREKLNYVSEKFSIKKLYADYEHMLKREDLDCVSVCTPNYIHAKVSMEALRSGMNVLCEKPFAMNVEEVHAVIDEASRSGKIFMANFSRRFDITTKIIKSFIDNDRFGQIYYAKCSYLRRKGHPGLGGWFTHGRESGGGALVDIGIHVLELGLNLMGYPKPVSVLASTYDFLSKDAVDGGWPPQDTRIGDIFNKTADTEDLAVALIKFDNGSTLLLEAGWAGYSESGIKFSLFGTKAGLELVIVAGTPDEGRPVTLKIHEEIDGYQVDIDHLIPQKYSYWDDTFPGFIKHFVNCVRGDEKPIMSFDDLILIQKIIDAIYRSARSGKEENV